MRLGYWLFTCLLYCLGSLGYTLQQTDAYLESSIAGKGFGKVVVLFYMFMCMIYTALGLLSHWLYIVLFHTSTFLLLSGVGSLFLSAILDGGAGGIGVL